jgi:hypothetical protein
LRKSTERFRQDRGEKMWTKKPKTPSGHDVVATKFSPAYKRIALAFAMIAF